MKLIPIGFLTLGGALMAARACYLTDRWPDRENGLRWIVGAYTCLILAVGLSA